MSFVRSPPATPFHARPPHSCHGSVLAARSPRHAHAIVADAFRSIARCAATPLSAAPCPEQRASAPAGPTVFIPQRSPHRRDVQKTLETAEPYEFSPAEPVVYFMN